MTSDSSGRPDVTCAVCLRHTRADALAAQGVVLTGVEALLHGDNATMEAINSSMTRFIAHTAISLYAQLIEDIAYNLGADLDDLLAQYRRALNEQIAQEAGKASDS